MNEMALDYKTLKSYYELGADRIICEEEFIARSVNCLPNVMTHRGKVRIDCDSQILFGRAVCFFNSFSVIFTDKQI